eukprot:3715841-Prymnesium_polylepis.2
MDTSAVVVNEKRIDPERGKVRRKEHGEERARPHGEAAQRRRRARRGDHAHLLDALNQLALVAGKHRHKAFDARGAVRLRLPSDVVDHSADHLATRDGGAGSVWYARACATARARARGRRT